MYQIKSLIPAVFKTCHYLLRTYSNPHYWTLLLRRWQQKHKTATNIKWFIYYELRLQGYLFPQHGDPCRKTQSNMSFLRLILITMKKESQCWKGWIFSLVSTPFCLWFLFRDVKCIIIIIMRYPEIRPHSRYKEMVC